MVTLEPAGGLHAGEHCRTERTTQMVSLFTPIDTETQQRPAPRTQFGQIDTQFREDRVGIRTQYVRMRAQRCGDRIARSPVGCDATIGAYQGISFEQRGGDRDTEPANR